MLLLQRIQQKGSTNSKSHPELIFSSSVEDAIRSELFSLERFEEHARSLATAQRVTANPRSGLKLTPRLRENSKILRESYQYITDSLREKKPITPAAEWLIDSFHVVEEQLREIKSHLPPGFYRELPKLSEGFLKNYPRVYGLAWAYVAHTDSRFDPELLIQFVRAYQKVQHLTIGELWAIAITLRVVMIENLRRMAIQIVTSQVAREEADQFVDEVLGLSGETSGITQVSSDAFRAPSTSKPFLVQLVQRLRYQDPSSTPAVKWLNDQLAASGQSADEIVTSVHATQAATNLSVRNIITSFRLMSAYDWPEFFEKVSLVHKVFLKDSEFEQMDFRTRDTYRHAVEDLARGSGKTEIEVAQSVVRKVQSSLETSYSSSRMLDPGYYLISNGRLEFEKEIGYRAVAKQKLIRLYTSYPTRSFLMSLILTSLFLLSLPLALDPDLPDHDWLVLLLFGVFPASDLAVSFVNRFVVALVGPKHLARIELKEGPTQDLRTFIVVPTLLAREENIVQQFEQLEVHYLSNPEGDVRFAMLTDFTDSPTENQLSDQGQLSTAITAMQALNEKHGPADDGGPRFFLFHRKRLWNPSEGKWIGWERKRGKLHEFNRLLRGAHDTSYLESVSSLASIPEGVRYVITLDADTKLPKGSVAQLVGTLAHRLNRAVIDPKLNRVVEGYGVLQPRITASLPARHEVSIFQQLFSGECGIDPYASAVSDVYQDLFGEGSYTGKGIYDVDAFEKSLHGRIPENSLLSHDLFEGSFARCGYVSDVEFFEDFPSHSEVSSARNHRWVRGDWQLLPWILGRGGKSLSLIARWKMVDNLRRSLSYGALLALIVTAFCTPAASKKVWIGFALISLVLPPYISFLMDLIPRRRRIKFRDHLRNTWKDFVLGFGHVSVSVVLLAHHAWLYTDAILRACFRLFISRKHLLEWVTAAQAKSASSLELNSFDKRLKGSIILAVLISILVLYFNSAAIGLASPFIVMWCLSPAFARFISLPPRGEDILPLNENDTAIMRRHARRIWRFFTTFVTAEDHFLPPDNFQEDPAPVVAHRSSPTNFGLYLLSTVAAHDFGWCGLSEMTDRLEASLDGMLKLQRYRGHFYNWYDTRDLRPLDPKYVSAVDSGNLAGHLLTLSGACAELSLSRVISSSAIPGIKDSLALLKEAFLSLSESNDRRATLVSLPQLEEAIIKVEERLSNLPSTASDLSDYWDALELRAETLRDIVSAFSFDRGDQSKTELLAWAEILAADITSHARDFRFLLPWAQYLSRHTQIGSFSNGEKSHWDAIRNLLNLDLTLAELPSRCEAALIEIQQLRSISSSKAQAVIRDLYLDDFAFSLDRSAQACREIQKRLANISRTARELFDEMDFSFLFNSKKKLFSIGFRVQEEELDDSNYDLLASEARLTSYLAIAKGDVPVSHWFRLGRSITPVENGAALISWSGSMFEYLMPALVMYTPRESLLDQTYKLIVKRQIQYGRERNVPWGISESAYNIRDLELTYQYSNFGVPGLGLKRGLGNDLVIAPYATALASMIDPQAAVKNFEAIEASHGRGAYGFYESMDYTPSRLRENQKAAVIKAYMAHHQGMALISFANVIHNGLMRKRFHSDPLVQAAELLLQEKTPRNVSSARPRNEEVEITNIKDSVQPVIRKLKSPHHPIPSSHLLSNGRYAVMMTAAGSGYSRWKNLAITRWREDVTRDQYGSFIYLRDIQSDLVWSATYQPTGIDAEQSEITFSEDRVKIFRYDQSISSQLEVIVSPEDDAELRRLSLTNNGSEAREIEITSYSEVVLAPPDADRAHPAFSNLFVQTEFLPEVATLIATRRPRSATEARNYMAQVMSADSQLWGGIEYETDRSKFVGRGRTLRRPISVIDGRPLSNTVGSVLDPSMSLRVRVRIAPGATAQVCFTTLAADSRERVVEMAEKYHHPAAFERSSTLAWTQAQVRLHYLGIDPDEAQVFQKLANRVLYSDPLMRPSSEILKRNQMSVSGLWARGISGDLPIILVRIDDSDDQDIIRQLLRAHDYWRMKRLAVDVVILNEKASSYVQDLQISLEGMVRGSQSSSNQTLGDPLGKIFVLRTDLLSTQDRDLLLTYSRAILNSRQGSLSEQVMRMRKLELVKNLPVIKFNEVSEIYNTKNKTSEDSPIFVPKLEFFNGVGGFAQQGREYVIVLGKGQRTPAPWINVIANSQFGFHVSESGSGYTWSINSRENQITSWSNDPVVDPPSEAFYLKDLESGKIWSPTASPIRLEESSYVARHGMGYSIFENGSHQISTSLTQFVAWNDPIKISKITLKNDSSRPRKLSLTSYVEWVLGFSRTQTAPYISTEIDVPTGALFAQNPLNNEFGKRVSFIDFLGKQTSFTGDRSEFIGRNGNLELPAALWRDSELSGWVGAGLDPCGVLQLQVELAAGETKEFYFILGQAESREQAQALITKYRRAKLKDCLSEVIANWEKILGKIQVETPDRSMDLALNGWLLYQTLACRFWARAAFYQAGGAFGFRDQLQDILAVVVSDPILARDHILRASRRQFLEGDVQHWWHPPTGRGVRTHFSDDLLWLPYVVLHYLAVTEDQNILDQSTPFIEGPLLKQEQEDSYYEPMVSEEQATLYEHCARTLDISMKTGAHGLPLMGTGDWNDGMNRVGHEGKGESVWVGWFLHSILAQFAPVAEKRGDYARAESWRGHALKLKSSIESNAWDGQWYRRAYFDDGTPLGSASNAECRIDSIAQSWAVISQAGDPTRARQAMSSVEKHLIRSEDEMILLFAPPFDVTPMDPGYIKGYVPGVRENGGQYTHAAVWCVFAYAGLSNGNRAHELFSMLNPINHSSSRIGLHTYKVEPYVMAADIYGEAPHVGRGGWTWYTGSAGWMYRAGIESILGIHVRGDTLEINPCLPQDWDGYKVKYQHHETSYEIQIDNPRHVSQGIASIEVDGEKYLKSLSISLKNDGKPHRIRVILG